MKRKYIVIIILVLFVLMIKGREHYQYKKIDNHHKQVIQTMINNPVKGNIQKTYYGYIDIPKLKVRRVIFPTYHKKWLDKDFVCIFNNTNYLEEKVGNTILVGHNNRGLFKELKKLEINDFIYIHVNNQVFKYKVIKQEEVKYDHYIYSYEYQKHLLTIITCTSNKKKRLVVTLSEDIA